MNKEYRKIHQIILLGAAIIVMGIALLVIQTVASRDTVQCTAIITDIQRQISGTDTETITYIEYTYNGEVYQSTLGYSSANMIIGKEIVINIDPNNPIAPVTFGLHIGGLGCIIIGVIVVLFAIWLYSKKKIAAQTIM